MLHDPADDCNRTQLNYNLSSPFAKQNLDANIHASSQLNLLNTSTESLAKSYGKCSELNENLIISYSLNAVESDLLPSSHSAEKLSWTFFEQVDSLDNQLRSDVSTPPAVALKRNGIFSKSPCTKETASSSSAVSQTNDVNLIVANSLNALGMHSHHQQQQQPQPNLHILGQTQTSLQTTLPQGGNRLKGQRTQKRQSVQLQQPVI